MAEIRCVQTGEIAAADLPQVVAATSPCAAADIRVTASRGASALVPEEPLTFRAAFAERLDGTTDSILLRRDKSGDVEILTPAIPNASEAVLDNADDNAETTASTSTIGTIEAPLATGTPVGTAAAAECTQDISQPTTYEKNPNTTWYLSTYVIPTPLSQTAVKDEVVAAYLNWSRTDDNCGFPDVYAYGGVYGGTTTSSPDVGINGCLSMDSTNEVGFSLVPSGTIGLACVAGTTEATKVDFAFLNQDNLWFTGGVPAGCSGDYSIDATATHEIGHWLGLGDITSSSGNELTMYGATACSRKQTSIGCGDYIRMRILYSTTGSC